MTVKAHIPAAIRKEVFKRFDCCAACGTWDADQCGHLVAEANGGEMSANNMIRLCGYCNQVQGTATAIIAVFASYTESPAVIMARRAIWAKYCKAALNIKVKPYAAK